MAIEPTRNTAGHLARALGAACAALLALFAVVPSAALGQAANFAGQHISIIVGTPAGGGYDAYARLAARHLGSFLPGNPSVIVQNMPGAGSLIAANWLSNVAPTDGTAIAILPSAAMFEPLLGNSHAQFDLRKVKWLASLNDYTAVAMVWHETPFMQAKDLISQEVIVGGSGTDSDVWVWPNLLNVLIGTKFRVVSGYPGTAGISLAMERGEVQGLVGDDWDSIKSNQNTWLRDQKIRILMQMRATRHPDLPDVPTALEFASEDTRDVLALFIARQSFGRPFLAPPETPGPILTALRQGFAKMLDDADFLRDAQQVNLTIKGANGDDIAALVDKIATSPKSVIDRASAEMRRLDLH
jgi:tripartite-type tricarboxylate transporter receptor subunit TctC